MELLLFFLSGFLASFVGGVVPGAVNLNVVYITIHKGAKASLPVILAAGLGEMILSYTALNFGMAVEEYIQQNTLLQILIALILMLVGLLLFFKKVSHSDAKPKSNYGFLKGLLLSVFNPPVLVFWLLAFAFMASLTSLEPIMSIYYLTILFLLGVFLGKLLVLYGYVKLSEFVANRVGQITHTLNQIIAIVLFVVGMIQLVRLLL